MGAGDKINEKKILAEQLSELEEARKKRQRQAVLEQNNFIQSQITHAAQENQRRIAEEVEEAQREQEQAYEERQERKVEEAARLAAEEERLAEEEADNAIEALGFKDGALDEETCRKIIDDLCAGKTAAVKKKETQDEAVNNSGIAPDEGGSIATATAIPREMRAVMIGNTLRSFIHYVASEAQLSNKHVEAARLCNNIIKRATKEGISRREMGLTSEEATALKGSVQLGIVVRKGLLAKQMLADPNYNAPERSMYLRDYLIFKGIEQVLLPHAEKHSEAIAAGESPLSSVQFLLGSPGFSASELSKMVTTAPALHRFAAMEQGKVAELVSRNSAEMDALGVQVITACYDGTLQKEKEPSPHNKDRELQKGTSLIK